MCVRFCYNFAKLSWKRYIQILQRRATFNGAMKC